jgi:hypothetical protein
VIPRGVTSGSELQSALRRELLVAAHYADFDARHAHVILLAYDQRAYVSYRLGCQIYWTKKQVTLPLGETLLSDGEHLARTRCGNRVSLVPAVPTSEAEPAETVLSTPIVLPHIDVQPESRPNDPAWLENVAPPAVFSLNNPLPAPGSVPGGGFPPLIPVFCCGGSPSIPTYTLPQPLPPTTSTPESGSPVLLLLGLGGVMLLLCRRPR